MEQDSSQKHLELSNELMFKSIKASMEHLEDEVSDMAETLEALLQERTMVFPEKMT